MKYDVYWKIVQQGKTNMDKENKNAFLWLPLRQSSTNHGVWSFETISHVSFL